MTSVRMMFALVLVMVAILLAAGCAYHSASVNQSDLNISTITTPAVPLSKALYRITIDQSNNSHPDFIKMDSDVFNRGEVIEFYVVNEGTETLTCWGSPLSYNLYRKSGNDSWEYQTMAVETRTDFTTYFKPGESTHKRRWVTTDWIPGHYRIAFDCNISREFILRETPPTITTVVPVSAEPTDTQRKFRENATYWIRIDPVGKHYTHDVFQITGTSNLPAGKRLIYDISRPNQPPRTPLVGGSLGDISPPPLATTVSAGKVGINTWSFTFNSEYYREPGTYRVDIRQEAMVFPEYVRANTSFVLMPR